MKITLSRKNDPRGKHIVLMCATGEKYDAQSVILSEILPSGTRPVSEFDQASGKWLYRFNLRYFDRLALAFPMADLSPGVHQKLKRAEEKRLAGMPIPKLT